MNKLPLVFLLAGFAVVTAVAAQDRSDVAPRAIQAQALDNQPQTRVEAKEALDGSVAASLIGAVVEQFDERKVAVKLDTIAVAPASVRDRALSGAGRLQIGDDTTWIPFKFSAQYDTSTTSVSYPRLVIGGETTQELAATSPIARTFSRSVSSQLQREFTNQPSKWVAERLTSSDAGGNYLHVTGSGRVDFGPDGATPAQVDGLYDRKNNKWVRVGYELGETANWSGRELRAVVAR